MNEVKKPVQMALKLFEKGYKVFPLIPNGKTPAFPGWQEWAQKANIQKITNFGKANSTNNWGVYCGPSGLMVIDVDNKGNKKGSDVLSELITGKEFPETFTVKTPTGGYHYYFKGSCKSGVNVFGDGIDVKSQGGYVVAPGSIIDNSQYELHCNKEIVAAPGWLYKAAPKKDPVVLDDRTVLPEGNRNESVTRIAGALRRHGLSYEGILAAIEVENEKICNPPLELEELKIIARSVSRYSPEAALVAQDFESIKEEETSKPVTLNDLSAVPRHRDWIIKDWLPMNEITSLYGSGGTGKSLLSLQLAIAIATGQSFLGMKVENTLPTLAVFCEDDQDEIHRRAYDIQHCPEYELIKDKLKKSDLFLWPRVGLNNDIARISDKGNDVVEGPFRSVLTEQLKTMKKGPKLLILDTLSDIYLGDENVREKVNKFVKTHIGGLVKEFELTILILAHPSRTGKNTGDMLSGSTAWENAVRNRLAFFKHKKYEDIMILKRMKSNYAKHGEEKFLTWNAGRFIEADMMETSMAATSAEDKDILISLAHIYDAPGDYRLKTVARKLIEAPGMGHLLAGKSPTTVARRLQELLLYDKQIGDHIYRYFEEEVSKDKFNYFVIVKQAQADNSWMD